MVLLDNNPTEYDYDGKDASELLEDNLKDVFVGINTDLLDLFQFD